MAQLDAMGHCWVAQLALYNFTVLYKSGKTNIKVDGLWRINLDWKHTSEVVRVILKSTMDGCSLLPKISPHTMTIIPSFQAASGITRLGTGEALPKQMTAADWAEAQMQDWDLIQVIWLYKVRQLDTAKLCDFESREVKALLHHWLKLKLWDRFLYLKTSPNQENQKDMRLVLPWAYHALVMHGYHDELGHLATELMLDLLHDQFYWPTMPDDVDQHI